MALDVNPRTGEKSWHCTELIDPEDNEKELQACPGVAEYGKIFRTNKKEVG